MVEDNSVPKIDEIAVDNKTTMVKLESKNVNGPEEKVQLNQITDYTDFSVIDKLDKETYITDAHRTYVPSD